MRNSVANLTNLFERALFAPSLRAIDELLDEGPSGSHAPASTDHKCLSHSIAPACHSLRVFAALPGHGELLQLRLLG